MAQGGGAEPEVGDMKRKKYAEESMINKNTLGSENKVNARLKVAKRDCVQGR